MTHEPDDLFDPDPRIVALMDRIAIDPNVCLGKPVVRGTRMPVNLIVEGVAYSGSVDAFLEGYDFLSRDDVVAALVYSARFVADRTSTVRQASPREAAE